MKEKLSIDTQILELSNSNQIYMTMDIRILSSTANANDARFTEDFINGTVENKKDYIGIPMVVDRKSLEKGSYTRLTHKNEGGKLGTDQIGSFVDFWSDTDENGVLFLAGSIRIMKRFTKTCDAIIELYESEEGLSTSCEVAVTKYDEVSSEGERVIGYNNGDNKLFASCIVTNPADEFAKADILVAEAFESDKKTLNKEIAHKVSYHVDFSSIELSEKRLYNLLDDAVNETKVFGDYEYYIQDIYPSYIIVESYSGDYDKPILYKIRYQISEDGKDIILDSVDNWVKGREKFVADEAPIEPAQIKQEKGMDLMTKEEKLAAELAKKEESKKAKEKEDLAKKDDMKDEPKADDKKDKEEKSEDDKKDKKKEVKTDDKKDETSEKLIGKLELENKELAGKLADAEALVVAENAKVKALKLEVAELTEYKDKFETAQKEEKIKELSEKFTKILDESVFETSEVQDAIKALDESKLNSIVVAQLSTNEDSEKVEDITILAEDTDTKLDKEDIKARLFSKVK